MIPFAPGFWRPASAAAQDPYYGQVSLLVHFDGSFADSSSYNHTPTLTGSPTTVSTHAAFDNSGSFGSGKKVKYSDGSAAFAIGGGDFTIEAWIRVTSLASLNMLLDSRGDPWPGTNDWFYSVDTFGSLRLTNGGVVYPTAGGTIAVNTNYFVASSRNGTVLRHFINGTKVYEENIASWTGTTKPMTICGTHNTAEWAESSFSGYVDEIRITKGVGRYTANYSVQTAKFPNS